MFKSKEKTKLNMRRLILESSEKELSKVGLEIPLIQKVKSLDLLYFLRQTREEFAAISRVELKHATGKVGDVITEGFPVEAQILEQEKAGTYIVFVKGGPMLSSVLEALGLAGGYLFLPVEIREGKIKVSFLGSELQVSEFLEKINALGIRYRVVLLSDASFSLDSPFNKLTEKQKEIVLAAYKFGYYDIPRQISSLELAKKLNIGNATLGEHLRKAERRLIVNILAER
jgi:hypothetical protein